MENFENNDLIPEQDPQPEATEPVQDPIPVAAEATRTEEQPPKYEWDCGMEFPAAPQKKVKPNTPKPRGGAFRRVLACVLVAALVAGGCLITSLSVTASWQKQSDALHKQNSALQQQLAAMQNKLENLQEQIKENSFTGNGNSLSGTGTAEGLTPGQVYAKNQKAVVSVNASTVNDYGSTGYSSGTGFILTENGYVITNYHVVEGSNKLEITTSASTVYEAKLVGFDATHDIAVLKVEATGLPHVTLGSSDALIIGDQVTVIGNPFGELGSTLTVGYISGKDRQISTSNTLINMLQTDAAVNSGNSGGPMFNMKGEVVGIITAKYSGTTASGASIEGIGFAIPIDDVAKKIQDLIEFGYITGPFLGVGVRDVDATVSQAYGLPLGAYVVSVEKDYCAYAAGIREKDIIISLGEYTIKSLSDLSSSLQEFKPGDTVTITVWRSGQTLELEVTLDEKPH